MDGIAYDFEEMFHITLEAIHEKIDEQKEELLNSFDEPPYDGFWGADDELRKEPDAKDGEITAMFESLFE